MEKKASDYKNLINNLKMEPLHYVFNKNFVDPNGLWLEFGVYSGKSINFISSFKKIDSENTVYGFDSFEGLPEEWSRHDRDYGKGFFDMKGKFPNVEKNVKLIKGWFNESLPLFMKENINKKITFLHIDCDLYSSTKTVFDLTKNNIADNCIIVFDELINYPNYINHEWKAWWEFVEENNIEFEWIGLNGDIQNENSLRDRGTYDQKVAVRIIKNPSFNLII